MIFKLEEMMQRLSIFRYKCLVYYLSDEPIRDANTCRNILKKIGMETYWRIGKTKVKVFSVSDKNAK